MSRKPVSPTEKKLRALATLSDAQDEALDRAARVVSAERGTRVSRAAVAREALRLYCRDKGVEWPS